MFSIEKTNRLVGLVYVEGELRVLKRDICSKKKKLLFVPADTTLLRSTLRSSAVRYFTAIFGEAATKNNVTVLKTVMCKGGGPVREEHFVLFEAPSDFVMKPHRAEAIFEDRHLRFLPVRRQALLEQMLVLAREKLGLPHTSAVLAA